MTWVLIWLGYIVAVEQVLQTVDDQMGWSAEVIDTIGGKIETSKVWYNFNTQNYCIIWGETLIVKHVQHMYMYITQYMNVSA